MSHWTESETKALISIWGSGEVQEKLDGVIRNRNVYETISQELSKVSINRNWKQCRDRIKNLLAKYRKTKDNNRQTGNNRHNCPYYKEIDAVIGTRPVSEPPLVVQSDTVSEDQQPLMDDSYQGISEELTDEQELIEESPGPTADDDLSELESTSSTTTTTESVESLISGKKISKGKLVERNVLLRKKRKHTNVDESLDNMVEKLIKRDEIADKRYMELEERRLKREQEIEERRQIREQEHEKNMQMMFLQFMQQLMQSNSPYAGFTPMPHYDSH